MPVFNKVPISDCMYIYIVLLNKQLSYVVGDKAEKPQRMRYEKLDRYKFKMADDKLYFAT